VLSYNFSVAHNHTLIGKIECNYGENKPIPGATVRIENTTLGTIANSKGEFQLKHIPDGKFNLIISAVGFKTQIFPLEFEHTEGDDIKEFNISMEEIAISTPDLVVTATRSEKIYEDTPVKLSVVSQSVLKSTNSLNIKEGLSFQPGLRIENTCQNCGVSQIRINGLEGHYTQVLIDSRPIFSALNGVYGLEQIPSIMIDRIEVVRGGGSSLYGSSAIAGVVNIITKDPSINYYSGSYIQSFTDGITPDNTFQMNASLVNDNQDIGVYIFGLNRNRTEWDANGDGFTEVPKLDLTTFGLKAFYKPTNKTRVSAEYNIINDESRGGKM
jgi:outer membrane receptor for ferrienterochelin and colicins